MENNQVATQKNEIGFTFPEGKELGCFQDVSNFHKVFYEIQKKIDDQDDLDVRIKKDREAMKSLAYSISRTKTVIDEQGKALVADLKKLPKIVDQSRKELRDKFDAFRDAAKSRVTAQENIEEGIKSNILIYSNLEGDESSIVIEKMIERLQTVDTAPVFIDKSIVKIKSTAVDRMQDVYEQTKRQEEFEAEQERLRIEREQLEEQKRQLEQKKKLEEEKRAAAEEAREQERRKAEAEKRRIEQEAERKAQEAIELAQKRIDEERRQAEQAEKMRHAEAEAQRKAEIARQQEQERIERARAQDREHRRTVNNEIVGKIVASTTLTAEQAVEVVTQAAKGNLGNLTVLY